MGEEALKITEYFDDVETTREYNGYFAKIFVELKTETFSRT